MGCPFTSSTYYLNTKDIEKDVLRIFASLWGINSDKVWGYITSAETEGNLQGLYVGREHLGDNTIFYTSKDSHYSIFKIAKLLKLDMKVINTHESGEMNYEHFEDALRVNIDKSVLINANLGTTMKGATDNTREPTEFSKSTTNTTIVTYMSMEHLWGSFFHFLKKTCSINHIYTVSPSQVTNF